MRYLGRDFFNGRVFGRVQFVCEDEEVFFMKGVRHYFFFDYYAKNTVGERERSNELKNYITSR